MKKYKSIVKQEVYEVVCDMCGQVCHGGNSSLTAWWGYGSEKDGTKWESDFCEQCSEKIKDFIKHNHGNVVVKEYLIGERFEDVNGAN